MQIARFMVSRTFTLLAVRCFPQEGMPTPTLTIVALSIRIADQVKSQMAEKLLSAHGANQKSQISEVLKTDGLTQKAKTSGLTQKAKTSSAASQTLPLSLP